MTSQSATSQTEARKLVEVAARKQVGNLILASELPMVVSEALAAIAATGSAFVCGVTITLTRRAQDAAAAAVIRNMSDAAFERFAYGK